MMKKLFALALMAFMSLSALAQSSSYNYYKFKESAWNIAGRVGITYNLVNSVPEGMSRSGLGLDFCLLEGQFLITRHSILSLGMLDIQIDNRYLQKGYVFTEIPYVMESSSNGITRAPEDARARGRLTDVTFSVPFGFTQRFNSRWAASLYVAPGIGLIRYRSDYINSSVHYHNSFHPVHGRAGFRLDLKAIVWFEDMGLMVRYQPVGFTTPNFETKAQTFSVGLAFCY